MKRTGIGWLLALVLSLVVMVHAEGPQKMPPKIGKAGPEIIVFNGARPRMGNIVSELFMKAGCQAVNVNGTYLDGFCGTTIKINMSDKVEPVPFDGITPALNTLGKQPLVVFNDIPEANLAKMLTPERIAQLRTYVQHGGHLLFTLDCPATVGDLLPGTLGNIELVNGTLTANRPADARFASFPESLPVFYSFRKIAVEADAEIISMIRDDKGNDVAPYIVRKKLGDGSVTYFNGEYTYAQRLREFSNWAYGKSFFMAVASFAGDLSLPVETFIEKMQAIPARVPVGEVSVSVEEPSLGVVDCTVSPVLDGQSARFANGCILEFTEKGMVSITYPNEKSPLIRDAAIPEIAFSAERSFFDAATAEATDGEAAVTAADITWQFNGATVDGKALVLAYCAKNSRMEWRFTAGTLQLDGREYQGIADDVRLLECPLELNEIVFHSQLTPEEPLFARRNSCYSPPRGYVEFDMSGKTSADTFTWRYLGSGQPFELLVCRDGVYLGNMEDAEAVVVRFTRKKDASAIANLRRHMLGRISAPCGTTRYWHWFSRGAERGHNDYLAMYQYVRRDLRRRAGLKELPAYPICSVTHQISADEQRQVREAAVKAGYRFFSHPGCEEPADVSFRSKRFGLFQELLNQGVGSRIWTAGSYVQGDGGWIYNNHPEWFVRDPKGKIFCYGNGRYPVIDINNEEYLKWYFSIAKPAIESGVRWVYRDMDGAAANCINYATKQSPHGTASQIRVYQFFHEHNCRVAIEGMNPLVLDEYWYRPALYKPFAGNEFSLVGSVPVANFYEGLELDFFRTGMYGCFPSTEFSGYALQFERVQDELARAARMVSLVPRFNEALDNTGMPYIRETPFGTTWIGENGGALFFWNPTEKVTVNLPDGWKIKGVEGNVLTHVPADAIFLLERQR